MKQNTVISIIVAAAAVLVAYLAIAAYGSILHMACSLGQVPLVGFLVERGANVNATGRDGFAPLHIAAHNGYSEMALYLIEHGAHVNALFRDGWAPIHSASWSGSLDIIAMLLRQGASINMADGRGWTPLLIASHHGDAGLVEFLLSNGADLTMKTEDGWTALHAASSTSGHAKVVDVLLGHGADMPTQDKDGNSPLLLAIRAGDSETVDAFIRHGANVNMPTRGEHPLLAAFRRGVRRGDVGLFDTLLRDGGADPNTRCANGWSLLQVTAAGGHGHMARLLLDHGAELNTVSVDGWSPLSAAVAMCDARVIEALTRALPPLPQADGPHDDNLTPLLARDGDSCSAGVRQEMVDILLARSGADPDLAPEDDGTRTPLRLAVHGRIEAVAQALLARGANANALDQYGYTPLHAAAEDGDESMVAVLLDHHSNVNAAANKQRWTPLRLAALFGHHAVVDLLLGHGANVNAREREDWTPLHMACQGGHSRVIHTLLAHGAAADAQSTDGRTPADLAVMNKHTEAAQLCRGLGKHDEKKED